MPEYTDNHGFQLFANGEEQWEHRTDFEQLDTDVPIVDSNANRTHYAPKSSAVYIADDTGDVYIGLGSQWDHLGTIGGSGGGGGDVEWRDDGTAIATSAVADLGNNLSVTTGPDGEAVIHAAGGGTGSGDLEWLDNGESRLTSATADLGDNLTVTTGDNGEARIDASSGSSGSSGTAQGGEVVVTEGSELQDALNSNGVVRISGRVDVTNYSPITVPNYRSVFGHGSFELHNHPQEVDIIEDSSSGPTLHVTGNHCKLHGFAIAQRNKSSGTALKLEGYSANVSHLDIDGGYRGIKVGDRVTSSGTTHTEPRILWCKIFPYGGEDSTMPGSGSTGIYVEDMHDAKIIHNIIGGYDIGVELQMNHAYLTGNHIYAYPRDSMSTGIKLGDWDGSTENEARYVRIVGNRVEDNVTGRGILFDDWWGDKYITNNLLEVHNGATGIERSTTNNTHHNMMIQNNIIRSSGGTPGGTALDIAPRNQNSTIGNNVVDNMTSVGNATIQSNGSPSASNHMPGAMVVDATTGDLYYRSTVGMHQIG